MRFFFVQYRILLIQAIDNIVGGSGNAKLTNTVFSFFKKRYNYQLPHLPSPFLSHAGEALQSRS
jgi:hypothetical protein